MKILAFDTANFSGSIALGDKATSQIWATASSPAFPSPLYLKEMPEIIKNPRELSSQLVPRLQALLDLAPFDLSDLDLLVCTTGPGSFTGVRLGLALTRGLHLATGIPAVGLDSFTWIIQSLPETFQPEIPLFVALETGRDGVYGQLFHPQRKTPLTPPLYIPLSHVDDYLQESVWVLGNGTPKVTDARSRKMRMPYTDFLPGHPNAETLLEGIYKMYTLYTQEERQTDQHPPFPLNPPGGLQKHALQSETKGSAILKDFTQRFPCVPFYLSPPSLGVPKKRDKSLQVIPFTEDLCQRAAVLHQASCKTPWSEEDFKSLLSHPGCFGLTLVEGQTHRCYGLILVQTVQEEGEILTFAIHPKFQRKGWGSLLLTSVIDHLRTHTVKRLFLEVSQSNEPALKLYRNNNFKPVGQRSNYYQQSFSPSHAQDALVMEVVL